ncbi:MAG TPA: cytochrome c biogenesis protein ResB [Candidatus Deferrimicrobiaceae bacterium]|nr:cytochrome c biogenesis protein ResB [Candidatus Deferrimicrobiaceae bacterium]
MTRAVWRFLTSHTTCVWVGVAFCLAGAAGSLALGRYPGVFSDMDAHVLLEWFARKGFAAPGPTLWLYGLLLATALMAVNVSCCTFERLVQIFRGHVSLRRLLPHVMHLAFLGVVFFHLVSSVNGDRIPGLRLFVGGVAPIGRTGWALKLDRLDVTMAREGYPRDVRAAVTLYRDRTPVAREVVRTNDPLFHEGYGVYLKDFGPTPWGARYAVFDANRDPGAPGVLVFSVLFTAANLLYLIPPRSRNA